MPLQLTEGVEPISGYRLVRLLGTGGYGQVWEALAPGGMRVALKFIRTDNGDAQTELRALDAIRNVRHAHLLDIHFAIAFEEYLVIGTSLCDQNLQDRFNECRNSGFTGIPRDDLLRYMDEAATALDYLNEPRHGDKTGQKFSIQHRDIKPLNLFLVGDSIKVADFGLAKILSQTVTGHTGSMTPHYASPEMLDGQVSNFSDQYSLAVTYLQMRTGTLPFTGSLLEVLNAHAKKEPNLSALPVEERSAVRRALAKDPSQRWPSCRAFVAQLRQNTPVEVTTGISSSGASGQGTLNRGVIPEHQQDLQCEKETDSNAHPQAADTDRKSPRSWQETFVKPKRTRRIAAVLGITFLVGIASLFWNIWQYKSQSTPDTIQQLALTPESSSFAPESTQRIIPIPPKQVPIVHTITVYPDDAELKVNEKSIEVTSLSNQRNITVPIAMSNQPVDWEVSRPGYRSVRNTMPTGMNFQDFKLIQLKPLPAVYDIQVTPQDAELTASDPAVTIQKSGEIVRLTIPYPDLKTSLDVTASLKGYEPAKLKLTPLPDFKGREVLTLSPQPGVLSIDVEPPNAILRIDNETKLIQGAGGSRSLTVANPLPLKELEIIAETTGYQAQSLKWTPRPGVRDEMSIRLQQIPSRLTLKVKPANAKLEYDSESITVEGTGEIRDITVKNPLPVRELKIVAKHDSYQSATYSWTPNQTTDRVDSLELVPKPAVMKLTIAPLNAEISPSSADIEITGSGEERILTVVRPDKSLKSEVTIRAIGYQPRTYSWATVPGKTTSVSLSLVPQLLIAPFSEAEAQVAQQRWAEYLNVKPKFTSMSGMKLILIPPGEYSMGTSSSEIDSALTLDKNLTQQSFADEKPLYRVKFDMPFYLGQYEVTRDQFAEFVSDQKYRTESETDGKGASGWNVQTQKVEGPDPKYSWNDPGFLQYSDHPVVNVSWKDAIQYCDWLSNKESRRYRLPSEMEWEYACRAGTLGVFSFGNKVQSIQEYANVNGDIAETSLWEKSTKYRPSVASDGNVFTSRVGAFQSNPFGLYDMHGNVAEFVSRRPSIPYLYYQKADFEGLKQFLSDNSQEYWEPREEKFDYPDVTLRTGQTVDLAQHKNENLLLIAWNFGCCNHHGCALNAYEAISELNRETDIKIYTVRIGDFENRSSFDDVINKVPVIEDDGTLAEKLKFESFPYAFLITPGGKVHAIFGGGNGPTGDWEFSTCSVINHILDRPLTPSIKYDDWTKRYVDNSRYTFGETRNTDIGGRGGSFATGVLDCRSASRGWLGSDNRRIDHGFRVVMEIDLPQQPSE